MQQMPRRFLPVLLILTSLQGSCHLSHNEAVIDGFPHMFFLCWDNPGDWIFWSWGVHAEICPTSSRFQPSSNNGLRKKVTQGRETKAAMTNLRCSSNKQGCMHTLTRMFVQSMYDFKKKMNYNFAPANASHTKPWHNTVHMGEPLKMWPELNNLTQIVECLQLYGNPGYVVSPSLPTAQWGEIVTIPLYYITRSSHQFTPLTAIIYIFM